MNSDIVVLIPHYNNLEGLYKSLHSIRYASAVEVVIVDDGSIIKPNKDALQETFADHLNFHVLYNKNNQGIEHTLNNGLKFITEQLSSKYIARLDCGDLCHESRLFKQKNYLDLHTDVYLVGSWVKFITELNKEIFVIKSPAQHENIVNDMYLKCSFIHPSVMFRSDAIKDIGVYPVTYKAAEDYAFFFKFVKSYRTYIFPEVLTYCELNPSGISLTRRSIQLKNRLKIIWENKSFNPYFFLGIVRNSIILITPYKIIEKAKTLLFR